MRLFEFASTSMTTLPPCPPLPPSGPPMGRFFSRRKLHAPGPPLPARATMRTRSTNINELSPTATHAQPAKKRGLLSRDRCEDVDPAVDAVEFHDAVREGEEGVVASDADVGSG